MNHRAFLSLFSVALLSLPSVVHAADDDDLVLLTNGGRIRGEVIEQDPQQGVRIKLADGTVRVLKASDVREVKYHDEAPVAPQVVAAPPVETPTTAPATVVSAPPVTSTPNAPTELEKKPFKRFDIGFRSTFAVPFGAYTDEQREDGSAFLLSDYYFGQAALALELGVWVTPRFMVGVFGHYGIMALKTGDRACPSDMSCSEHETRFGLQGHYHFSPDEAVDPWIGFGFGYQNVGYTYMSHGVTTEGNRTGPEYLNLQFGANFALSPSFSLAPVIAVSVGEYTKYQTSVGSSHIEGDIEKTALHEWVSLGVRGAFRL